MHVATPAARATDPNASHDAAEHMTATGRRAYQQTVSAAAVLRHPGLTSNELSKRAKLDRYMLARRLPECETGGAVKRGPERRCSVSGRLACTWWPVEAQIQPQLALIA